MPRPYSLGKRAAAVSQTRERIIQAAMRLYLEEGAITASMQEVARRADVAPGTVLYHFPDAETLAKAVLTDVLEELRLPAASIFRGKRWQEARIRTLFSEMYRFYERSGAWYRVYERERGRLQAIRAIEADFQAGFTALVREALAPDTDEQALLAVSALCDAAMFSALTLRGLSTIKAAETAAELAGAWLGKREKA